MNVQEAMQTSNPLQALLDGPDMVIDLQGQNLVTPPAIFHMGHNGKRILGHGGRIFFQPWPDGRPFRSWLSGVQGDKYGPITYPAGDLDFHLGGEGDHLTLDGGFNYNVGNQSLNEAEADRLGLGHNLFGGESNPLNHVTMEGVHFANGGNSGYAGTARHVDVKKCTGYRVAKHLFGFRAMGGSRVCIDNVVNSEGGNLLDFTHPNKDWTHPVPDVANVRNVTALNENWRAKQACRNWEIYIRNWYAAQDTPVCMNLGSAFDATFNCRVLDIDGMVVKNYPCFGLASLSDPVQTPGTFAVRNLHVVDSVTGFRVQQKCTVAHSVFSTYQRYTSGTPVFQTDVTDGPKKTKEEWAEIFRAINILHAQHGITVGQKNGYVLPKEIAALIPTV